MSQPNEQQLANAELLRSIWRRLTPTGATEITWKLDGTGPDPLSWPLFFVCAGELVYFEPRDNTSPDSDYYSEDEHTEDGWNRGAEVCFGPEDVAWDEVDASSAKLVLREAGQSYGNDDHEPLDRTAVQQMSYEELSEALRHNRAGLSNPGLERLYCVQTPTTHEPNQQLFRLHDGDGPAFLTEHACLLMNQNVLVNEYFLRLSRDKAPEGAVWAVWTASEFNVSALVGYLGDDFSPSAQRRDKEGKPLPLPWLKELEEAEPNPLGLWVDRISFWDGSRRAKDAPETAFDLSGRHRIVRLYDQQA